MTEFEYVGKKIQVGYAGILSLKELYNAIWRWYQHNGYNVKEITHKNFKKKEKQDMEVVIEGNKEVTDYMRLYITLLVSATDIEEVEVKNQKKQMVECSLNIALTGKIEKDYEQQWSKGVVYKFLREVFDKFGLKTEFSGLTKQLNTEMKSLRNEIKAYLDLQRIE